MSDPAIVILGCGYTGRRVARRFLNRGLSVIATTRDPASLADLSRDGAAVLSFDSTRPGVIDIPYGALVLHSIPEHTPHIFPSLTRQPARIVYLSTTGVYGPLRDVDEHTPPDPRTESARRRLEAEEAVRTGPWSSLVLRPAAIYGPNRGVHVSMLEGRFQLAGDGGNFVSRIHVEDLASHIEAALLSDLGGAWPVADDLPCTSREIASFCARLFNVPMPPEVPLESLHETRRADRRVDGRAIRARLGITLQYPTYREGLTSGI